MLRRILASLNSSGVGVRVRMYICVCMCVSYLQRSICSSLEREQKEKYDVFTVVPTIMLLYTFVFVCVCACTLFLPLCGSSILWSFPFSSPQRFSSDTRRRFFFFHGIAVITRNIFWPLRDTVHFAFPFPLVCTADD